MGILRVKYVSSLSGNDSLFS